MAGSSGDDRVVAAAHHILRTFSSSHTDDMLRILSSFDDRFSRFSMNPSRDSRKNASDLLCVPSDVGSRSFGPHEASSFAKNDHRETDSEHCDSQNDEDQLPSALRSAEQMIMKWNTNSSTSPTFLFSDHSDQVRPYLDAIDSLHNFIDSLSSSSTPEACRLMDHALSILQFSMLRLEKEFSHLLQKHSEVADRDGMSVPSNRSLFDASSSFISRRSDEDYESVKEHKGKDMHDDEEIPDGDESIARSYSITDTFIDLLPPDVVTDLQSIVNRMLRSTYDTECVQAYVDIRKGVMEESLQKLGQEKFTFEEVQRMPWELLQAEISKWTRAMKIAIKTLFPSEKILCETVFTGSHALSVEAFSEVAKTSLMQLLNFGDAVAVGRRYSEKLFKILDMYECLQDHLSEIEVIFGKAVRTEAEAVSLRLGEAARGTFAEFENAVKNETSKNATPGGAVHPLSRYVMNYMRFLCDYTETMNHLLLNRSDTHNEMVSDQRKSDESPLSAITLTLMESLEKNLDAKSKLYKDPALAYLFLMNNMHYISQKIKASDVRKLLGDEWIKRNRGKLRQCHNSYRRTAWTKVLMCLKDEGINISGGFASSATRNVIKERFKNFNAAFEENVKAQSSWVVWDPQLSTELRISITEMILPAYRSFLGRFQNHLDSRHPEKYVKYTEDDLECYLNELFEGGSGNKRKSYPATGSTQ
ncbi:hypothetical protein KP509_36G038300 [Ceratopteris richardii]|uniref:Exocyst subunit Exo70 family protein n=1 Tax=Ceratopteris richardii TaxID=49495 RepID=A0A8T2QCE2_CERRI|nr:hypothetical protein KP509_36G038300 [Ceratopteris richardii]KAH7281265.1 hypothetical protein KP509_36G038300 [Ceratopteris richardii]